jgi:hypothetical protein
MGMKDDNQWLQWLQWHPVANKKLTQADRQ